ncbi:hypothetical protein EHQ58_10145 [Leptospira ognonensis]|uniref:CopG family transcriptional regulator n=1 Tax=Leptospira ognonensis TaxID=2484945 RepID=A0A4R9K0N9_9LEPT|nr:hypothetical protein [Leptospira ognonensis]TGL58671.1 hypothetical protein EHQ58_10145 [Leptospira ognonensis]
MSKFKKGEFERDIKEEARLKSDLKDNGAQLRVAISIKLDPKLLGRIKERAEVSGVGYQTLIHEKLMELFPEEEVKNQSKKIIKQIKVLLDDLTVAIEK